MKILLVTPTLIEAKCLEPLFNRKFNTKEKQYHKLINGIELHLMITGVSLPNTIYHLTKALQTSRYNLVLHFGIAGSFDRKIRKGTVVNVEQELFSDIGKYMQAGFQTIYQMNLANPDDFPFNEGLLTNPSLHLKSINSLKSVKAITVNTMDSSPKRIARVAEQFNPQIESMEGAGVFFVCLNEKVSFYELRAISNYVDETSQNDWKIATALKNMYASIVDILDELKNSL